MIGKIKEFNFKSLLITNTVALIVTSYFFNNFIFIGVYILFFYYINHNKEWFKNNSKFKIISKYKN